MKKFMMVCLAMVLVLSMSLTALAAPGSFVESPSNNKSPRIGGYAWGSPDCTAELVITSYADRDALDAEDKADIEAAYDDIKNTEDLGTLNSQLDKIAEGLEVNPDGLAVSDLFDMDYTGCEDDVHSEHGKATVTLEADTLEDFVALMVYVDGKWQIVEGAKIENGKLVFSTDQCGPFAIVVDNGLENPKTGDTSMVELWGILLIVSAAAVVVCLVVMKKAKAKN